MQKRLEEGAIHNDLCRQRRHNEIEPGGIPYHDGASGGRLGNPSSLYGHGQRAKEVLEKAREDVAAVIGAQPEEIYFTSGGTESDNWAIRSAAELRKKKGKHIISTQIEHHAVLHTLKAMEAEGFEVTLLDVHENGIFVPAEVEAAIREDTCLVTIMTANNEIGTIQPIREIGAICRKKGLLFHTDAVQAVGHIPLNVAEDNIDLLSASAHKFHGPKGVGFLYAKRASASRTSLKAGRRSAASAQERKMCRGSRRWRPRSGKQSRTWKRTRRISRRCGTG
jgi:cysteine desulfurase